MGVSAAAAATGRSKSKAGPLEATGIRGCGGASAAASKVEGEMLGVQGSRAG